MHAAGVLHRDLKPGNIMLRDDGSIALIDFGLSKDAALALDITETGTIFGTPHYMSPEQGHAEALDERSDLYSLGVILFEMLTRREALPRREPDGDRLQAPQGGHPAAAARSSPRCSRCSSDCSPRCPADRFAERAGSGRGAGEHARPLALARARASR